MLLVLVLVLVLVLEREEVVVISLITPDSTGPAVLDDTTSTVDEAMSATEDDRDGRVLLEPDVVEVEVVMTSTVEIGAELEALSMMLTTALWLELVEGLALRLDDEVVGSMMTAVEEEMTRDWDGSSSTRTAVDVMTGSVRDREDATRLEEEMADDEDSSIELVDDKTSDEVTIGGGEALDDEVDEDTGSSMMVELSDRMIVEDDAVLSVTVTVLVVSEEEVSILTNWVSVTSTVDRAVDVSGSGEGDGEGDGDGEGNGEGLGDGEGAGGGADDDSGTGSGSGKTLLDPVTKVIG